MVDKMVKPAHLSDFESAPEPAGKMETWDRVRRRLKSEVGEAVFGAWFAHIELVDAGPEVARLSVPTKFLKSWIQSHYNDRILAALRAEQPDIESLVIAVRTSSRQPARPADAPHASLATAGFSEAPRPATSSRRDAEPTGVAAPFDGAVLGFPARPGVVHDGDSMASSPLERRLTFATFLVGRSNQLAHAAAQRVAFSPPGETALYNPLYIHAAVGLGKTHLLHAIAHASAETGRRVIYLTAEKFMYRFVFALKAQTAITFKERLRGIDVLVIDDVQFLQGKSIQNEFCHTLNALIDSGKQIIVAADRPPGELESLDERVRSRLSGGLCVEMSSLDEPLRLKILEARVAAARAAQPGFEVSQAVVAYVARAIETNGRDLDGAVSRLLARATLTGVTLTVEMAEDAIRDLVRTREPRRVKIEDIQKLVANHYNVTKADILSSRRTATVVRPRQIAMYLSKVLTLRSLPEIGRRFGGRDHTTVLHAVRKIETLSHTDTPLSEELELLKRMLQE